MRRFPDLGVGSDELVAPAEVELQPRELRAAELPAVGLPATGDDEDEPSGAAGSGDEDSAI
jgi:hypothetical protein